MKNEDPFDRVEELLRSQAPDPMPSTELESKIHRALKQRNAPEPSRTWQWLFIPAATAVATVLFVSRSPVSPHPVSVSNEPRLPKVIVAPPKQATALASNDVNPLRQETRALQRDAKRAGRFLFGCLPSLGEADY